MIVAGWVVMAMMATGISAVAAYRYVVMSCEGVLCGMGMATLAATAFIVGMVCLSIGERVWDRQERLRAFLAIGATRQEQQDACAISEVTQNRSK